MTASDVRLGAWFGQAVAISGNTLLIGAPRRHEFNVPSVTNAVYHFVRSGTTWTEQAQKLAPAESSDSFGSALSISGDTAVIGAYNGGPAYVFVSSGGTWTLQQRLPQPANQGALPSHVGWSVGVSGNTVLVGTNRNNAAWAYVRSGTTWTEQQKIIGPEGTASDRLGSSVAVSGNTAMVGAPFAGPGGDPPSPGKPGAVYVYGRSGGVWTEQQVITASDGSGDDMFGGSVALSGDTAVIGAINDRTDGTLVTGAAYVFVRSGGTWTQQAKLTTSFVGARLLGRSVSLDGDTAVVADDSNNASDSVYVFVRSGTAWTEQQRLPAPATSFTGSFGDAVAVSGDTALVGSEGDDSSRGSAYVYLRSGTTWALQQRLTASDPAVSDYFSHAVALSGNTALVAAPEEDRARRPPRTRARCTPSRWPGACGPNNRNCSPRTAG